MVFLDVMKSGGLRSRVWQRVERSLEGREVWSLARYCSNSPMMF
jgi:hypothetical protein